MNPLTEKEILKSNNYGDYKGVYYNDFSENEFKLFEYGSHFNYNDLCKKLEKLLIKLSPDRRGNSLYEEAKIKTINNQSNKSENLKAKEINLKDSLNQITKLSEAINIKTVCDNIQKCLNKKKISINSKVVSEISQKGSVKTSFSQAHGNIILNSIININITNFNNPRNPTIIKNNEPKITVNKVSVKNKEKVINSTTSKFMKYMNTNKIIQKKPKQKINLLSSSLKATNISSNIKEKKFSFAEDKNIKIDFKKALNVQSKFTDSKLSPTYKKFVAREKISFSNYIKSQEDTPILNNRNDSKLTVLKKQDNKIPSNSINSIILNGSLIYNTNIDIKSRNVFRTQENSNKDISKKSTMKSKSQNKKLMITTDSKKSIDNEIEKQEFGANNNVKSSYNIYKNSCKNKYNKGSINKISINDKFRLKFLNKESKQFSNISNNSKNFSKYPLNESQQLNFIKN